jgi:hypothetical protein
VALNFLDIPAGARVALHMAIIILTIAIIGKIGVRLIDSLMRPERLPKATGKAHLRILKMFYQKIRSSNCSLENDTNILYSREQLR